MKKLFGSVKFELETYGETHEVVAQFLWSKLQTGSYSGSKPGCTTNRSYSANWYWWFGHENGL